MNMSKYCKEHGMNYEQFKQFQKNIETAADAIINVIKQNYSEGIGTGMYYPTNDILPVIPGKTDENINGFVIMELKKRDVEFRENNSLWRY